MNASEHLADQYRRALEGGAWHGPSWREVLEGVGREAALAHPVPSAHSIAEIVLHAAAWHEIVRQRVLGESPQVSEREDWPKAVLADATAWTALQERLFATGETLRETIATFPAERLHERRPGLSDTWYGLIIGELQHMLYHAGQIAILRKAAPK
jgi:hypothetical protein